jgi:hypothetical protein
MFIPIDVASLSMAAQVTDVDTSALGSRAGYVAVYATLDESAALHHADGRQADNYRTTYDAKYHVIQVTA